jgi:HAD superfamily hydrolase (TIGR01509 family)
MQGIIFDLDGTLVDSEPVCNQALLDLLPELPGELNEVTTRYRGMKLADIFADVEHRLSRRLPADFERQYRQRVAGLFESELKAMPGAMETLSLIDRPIGVASNGPAMKIRQALEITGLAKFFGSNVFSAYEVGCWKPAPGLFLHAAKEMCLEFQECAVVEDSDVGIAAALSAKMIAIHYQPHGPRKRIENTVQISDLSDLIDDRFWEQIS